MEMIMGKDVRVMGFGDLRVAEEEAEQFGKGKSVILTFDDGPEPEQALRSILETLKANSIQAEFYMIGKEVQAKPNLLSLVRAGNRTIQNHTWDHPEKITSLSEDKILGEVEQAQNVITEACK